MPWWTVRNDLRTLLKLDKLWRRNTFFPLFHRPRFNVCRGILFGSSLLVMPVSSGHHFPIVFDNVEGVTLHEGIHVSNLYRHLLKKTLYKGGNYSIMTIDWAISRRTFTQDQPLSLNKKNTLSKNIHWPFTTYWLKSANSLGY